MTPLERELLRRGREEVRALQQQTRQSARALPATVHQETFSLVVLPVTLQENFIHVEGLEKLVDKALSPSRMRADLYLTGQPFDRLRLEEDLAACIAHVKEQYPADQTYDPRLPLERRAWYAASILLPFVPSGVPVVGPVFQYVRRATTIAGAFFGLTGSLPTPDDLFGGVLFGALLGWTLPTLYGASSLAFDMVSRRLHDYKLKHLMAANREKRQLIQDIADMMLYQELPRNIRIIEDMAEDDLSTYLRNDYHVPRRGRTPRIVAKAVNALMEDEQRFERAPYALRRYYRQKQYAVNL